MNTATASFTETVRQITEMSQRKKNSPEWPPWLRACHSRCFYCFRML